jgi:transcriptional regulator with XRE-family HTH domain
LAHRKRVGAFIRRRRLELGLSQGVIMHALDYRTRMSISNIETGREGLPAKRIYAWADLLEVPRDGFFQFVTGEISRFDPSRPSDRARSLYPREAELVSVFRRLPRKYQERLLEQAREYVVLARATKGAGDHQSKRAPASPPYPKRPRSPKA